MIVRDPGHMYDLTSYDGGDPVTLQFMKRRGEGYPGNTSTYPGTNIQEVLRALIDQIKYLDQQDTSWYNTTILGCLRKALDCLEYRAAKRHRIKAHEFVMEIENLPTCKICGHIVCKHE